MDNKKTILIVDDEEEFRKILLMRLTSAGYEVIEAKDGEEAFNIAKEKSLDLIILDIMMPGMNGILVSQQLKDCRSTRNIPIIFLTVLEDKADEKLSYRSGENIIFAKPYDHKELLAMIKKLIG